MTDIENNENSSKFVDAEISKQRLEFLRKVEREKIILAKKQIHEEEVILKLREILN